MHRDGNVGQTAGDGAHIVHLHGYWYGSDTLHTPRQLNQSRPQLRSSLSHLLRNRIVVVLAYGGWDDAFTKALTDVVMDDNAYPEIIWCFRDKVPRVRKSLLELLRPSLDRGRISFYGGVDCHDFLPALVSAWKNIETPVVPERPLPLRPAIEQRLQSPAGRRFDSLTELPRRNRAGLVNADGDRPPVLDFYVGRASDLSDIQAANCRVAFVTGIGGQGKSALAASLFNAEESALKFEYRLWRDCKEESEKFEDHLILLIEALNDGKVLSGELAKQPIEALSDLFCTLTEDLEILIIFDNVDHYVDLHSLTLTGAAGAFVERFLARTSQARLVFTCRPAVISSDPEIYTKRLEGLSVEDALNLFLLRNANVVKEQVIEAHQKTGGHAFWLDLLAAQVGSRKAVRLDDLLERIATGSSEIPDATLRSIWQSLRNREQLVLQTLAEVLRPVSRARLTDILRPRLKYLQTGEALRTLRSLNLLVVKRLDQGEEGFELHPLIRAFIHKTFQRSERVWFIDAILSLYAAFFGSHRAELNKRPSSATIRQWLEGAELCINAGHFDQAFSRLYEVRIAMRRSASPVEYVKICQYLLKSIPVSEWREFQYFDSVFQLYQRSLVNLGRIEEARGAIERYEETLDGKDARYINYCDMLTYMYWITEDYVSAINWGKEGSDLKKSTGVDTEYSSDHHLALAERDSGAIDTALEYFLEGVSLDEVLAPDHFDQDRGGSYYGNIGRCLHLMGQIDPAIICYTKSAKLIETEHSDSDVENQAYIRQWIGELLDAKGEASASVFFLVAAASKWTIVSPPKAVALQTRIDLASKSDYPPDATSAEDFVLKWIRSSGVGS